MTKDDVQIELFVATNGSDAWTGRLAEPNADGTDGPLATLEAARDAVRAVRAGQGKAAPATVTIRGGVYRRAEPFVLRPEDSGVAYQPYPRERPVISGGRAIDGWQAGEGGLWRAAVPEASSGEWHFRSLFVNGQRRHRSRHPAEGYLPVAGAVEAAADDWAASLEGHDEGELAKRSFRFEPGDIQPDWTNLSDVEVVVLQYWTAARLRIASIDEANNSVLFTGGSFRPLTWSFGFYVDNVFEGLDAPGTWYLDRRAGMLYYRPLDDEDMTAAEVIAPVARQLVRLEGDADAGQLVRDVTFRGLAFAHTDWALDEAGYSFTQAELSPPAAIVAAGAHRCRIENCELAHLGGWGIDLGRGCQDCAVVATTVRDVGAGCVKVGEPTDCETDAVEACRTTIRDSRFLDGGQVYLGPAAVWIGQSSGNTVSHNEVSGQFQWAVSVGWNWAYFPLNRARDNVVEFNHIHELGTGVLGTHGAIYCLGISPGTVIRNNYVHNVYCNDHWGAGCGIILDNGCAGILVENNVVDHAVAGGWNCNFNCLGNIVINNIFAYGRKFQLTRYGDPPKGPPPPNGEVFCRNIVVYREGPLIGDKQWWSHQTLWDGNCYWNDAGCEVDFMGHSLEQWREKGLERHSTVADPLFVDAAGGDFTLRPDSPALKLGFRPIDLTTVGPRPAADGAAGQQP